MFPVKYTNLAASALVKSGPGALTSLTLTGGSDAATVILSDATSGATPAIIKLSAAANVSVTANFSYPLAFSSGCYATITGTAPSVTIGVQ